MSTPDRISTTPEQEYQPYDATDEGPIGAWKDLKGGGPAGPDGQVIEDFPDSGAWKQV